MAGHSKWANIKHRKGRQDAKRGKIFTKLLKEISIAAREGGGDIDGNARLRLAVQNAKGSNIPKDTIERAISKATGADADTYTEVSFEGYGPNGIAVFVECLTDNNNRTVSNVRAAFSKYGGSLGTNGSLEFLFERKGVFAVPQPDEFDEDDFTLEVIDAGAEEVEVQEGYVHITSAMEDFGNLQKKLDELNIVVESAELQRIPNTYTELENDEFTKVWKLIEALEDDDDVQKVYHNMEVKEEQLALVD